MPDAAMRPRPPTATRLLGRAEAAAVPILLAPSVLPPGVSVGATAPGVPSIPEVPLAMGTPVVAVGLPIVLAA